MTYDPNREILELERARVLAWELEQNAKNAPGMAQRVAVKVAKAIAVSRGLATANPYAALPLLIDYSHWNGTTHNWAALKANSRLIGVIHKLGEVDDTSDLNDSWNDSAFQTNFGGSAGAGIPSGAYFFDDGGAYALNHNWAMDESKWTPLWNDPKIKVIVRQLAYNPRWEDDPTIEGGKRLKVNGWRPFKFLVIDVERHWQSYSEYSKFLKGEITSYRKLNGVWINFSLRLLLDRIEYMMSRGMMKRVPVMVYTRKSFVDQYSPEMVTTLTNRKEILKWAAHYVVGAGNVSTTIDEIYTKYLPAETFRHYEIYGPSTFWQWSGDRYRIPESQGAIDLNFFMGTLEQFEAIFGDVPDPVEPPPDPVDPVPPDGDLAARVTALETQLTALEGALARHTHDSGPAEY